jgi:hypothetical protein
MAPVMCPVCMFWSDRIAGEDVVRTKHIPNFYSIRADGQHYTLATLHDHGPMMTVKYFDGTRVVSQRLRLQGPVPVQWKKILQDNAVIIEGNPENLPIGVTRP